MSINKFKEGDVVYAKAYPERKLVIRRGLDTIYYCRIAEDPRRVTELVYFERELLAENDPARKW